ncbi:MAG: hypothetical protein H0W70_09370, partial [Actinobacteria bacterium]|nr:hypothetical protein [Actinomycetota bacterium]
FSWMPDLRANGAFRVLWIGDPEALPTQGWPLGDGVAYALSAGGVPDVTTLWPASDDGVTGLTADALHLAEAGNSTRLGSELAPMAIRYIVVVDAAGPGRDAPRLGGLPTTAATALAAQLDLKLVSRDTDQLVYENAAWGPGRSRLARDRKRPETVRKSDIVGGVPTLRSEKSPVRFSGRARAGDTVYFAEAASANWQLVVGGRTATGNRALGWANAFTVERGGTATLHYRRSVGRIAFVAVEIVLWVAAFRYLVVSRRRRSQPA